jgi:hypothetical protein
MINQIIELNWVHYYGSKFNELIHDIWAIICFFLMLFLSFNFFFKYNFLLCYRWSISLFNSNLKEYNFTICCQRSTFVISNPHAYHNIFTFKKYVVLYKTNIMHFIVV